MSRFKLMIRLGGGPEALSGWAYEFCRFLDRSWISDDKMPLDIS
jgi:hypothetical protein